MERCNYANFYYVFMYACSRVFLKFDIRHIFLDATNNISISLNVEGPARMIETYFKANALNEILCKLYSSF